MLGCVDVIDVDVLWFCNLVYGLFLVGDFAGCGL